MKTVILTLCIMTFALLPVLPVAVQADEHCVPGAGPDGDYKFCSIVKLPIPQSAGGVDQENLSLDDFIRVLFAISVSIAALLAVMRIVYGGVQYMLTDVVTNKAKAKKDIYGAILGLIIVMASVFILQQINPQLIQFNLEAQLPADTGNDSGSAVTPANSGGQTQPPSLSGIINDPNDPRYNHNAILYSCGGGSQTSCEDVTNHCSNALGGTPQMTDANSLTCFTPMRNGQTQPGIYNPTDSGQCGSGETLVIQGGLTSCSAAGSTNTVIDNSNGNLNDIFAGPTEVSTRFDRDLERGGVLERIGITTENFDERVLGVAEVDDMVWINPPYDGDITAFEQDLRSACSGNVISSPRGMAVAATQTVYYCVQ